MSDGLNTCTLSGNLGADAEVRYTQGGMPVTSFPLGVGWSKQKADKSGYDRMTDWFDVTIYGKRGEALQAYLYKGAKVCVAGRLRRDVWEKDGKKCSKVKVVADDIDLMTMQRREQGPQAQAAPATPQASPQQPAQYDAGLQATVNAGFAAAGHRAADVYDDEIPF